MLFFGKAAGSHCTGAKDTGVAGPHVSVTSSVENRFFTFMIRFRIIHVRITMHLRIDFFLPPPVHSKEGATLYQRGGSNTLQTTLKPP